MRVDFHTHSDCSDGALSVAELLQRARDNDVQMFAITDHDTVKGVHLAAQVQAGLGESLLRLVSGVELSTCWQGVSIHVVGLNFDPDSSSLAAYLAQIDQARSDRAELIANRLVKQGFQGALEGALQIADGSVLGRPHFARWLVQEGHCESLDKAFKRWLGRGKIGDVKSFWPDLELAVQAITEAGGVAVLAHPHHYGMTRAKLKRLVLAFIEAGGQSIEMPLGTADTDSRLMVRRFASELGLHLSLGSDYHADSAWGSPIGVETALVGDNKGVWELWQ